MNYRSLQGFSLVEMLVGMAVAVVMIVAMAAILNQMGLSVRNASNKMDAFQSAQAGFDIMTQRLSDATLNTYYDYDSPTAPTTYLRHSDLDFYIGQNSNSFLSSIAPVTASANSGESIYFQAADGYSNGSTYANTPGLLNAIGYFVTFGPETSYWPSLFGATTFKARYRYRLMQAIGSTENNGIYTDTEGASAEISPSWIFSSGSTGAATPLNSAALPIAENIIALVLWPREDPTTDPSGTALSTDYQYNSRQGYPLPASANSTEAIQSEQMPPIVQVTMVAIDEASAIRLQTGTSAPSVIESALAGKFTKIANYSTDMASLEAALIAAHVSYQVLTSTVALRESKWSSGS